MFISVPVVFELRYEENGVIENKGKVFEVEVSEEFFEKKRLIFERIIELKKGNYPDTGGVEKDRNAVRVIAHEIKSDSLANEPLKRKFNIEKKYTFVQKMKVCKNGPEFEVIYYLKFDKTFQKLEIINVEIV